MGQCRKCGLLIAPPNGPTHHPNSRAIEGTAIGDGRSAIDPVRCQGDRVKSSVVDRFSDLARIVNFDAEVPHGAFDFTVPQQ
jgi:hypothetical protein